MTTPRVQVRRIFNDWLNPEWSWRCPCCGETDSGTYWPGVLAVAIHHAETRHVPMPPQPSFLDTVLRTPDHADTQVIPRIRHRRRFALRHTRP